ncbi:unnamed protein product, partial [Pleuronectes platessa]
RPGDGEDNGSDSLLFSSLMNGTLKVDSHISSSSPPHLPQTQILSVISWCCDPLGPRSHAVHRLSSPSFLHNRKLTSTTK